MPAEQEPPVLPVSDPSRPSFDDVLEAGSERRPFNWREHRLLTASLLAAVLVGGVTAALLHAHAAERAAQRASEVRLTVHSSFGSAVDAVHPDRGHHTLTLRLSEAHHRPFRIVSLSLLGLPATTDPLPSLAEPSTSATLRLDTDCARISRLPPQLVVLATVQRPGQRRLSLRLPLEGTSPFVESLQRDCGNLGVAESLVFEGWTVPSVHGSAATAEVTVRNGSRLTAQVVDVTLPDARVSVSPALPVELPPFAAGQPGSPIRLRLTVRYLRCPALIEGQSNDPLVTLVLVGPDGSRQSAGGSFSDWDAALRPLYSQHCR